MRKFTNLILILGVIYNISPSNGNPRPTIVVSANTAPPPQIVTANVVNNQVLSSNCQKPCQGPPNAIVSSQIVAPQVLSNPVVSQYNPNIIYPSQYVNPCVQTPVIPAATNSLVIPQVAPVVTNVVDNSVANSLAHALQLLIVSDLIEHTINSPKCHPPALDACVELVSDCVQRLNPSVYSPIEVLPGQIIETYVPFDGFYPGFQEVGSTEYVLAPFNGCGCNLGYSPSSVPLVNVNYDGVKACACGKQVPTAYYYN